MSMRHFAAPRVADGAKGTLCVCGACRAASCRVPADPIDLIKQTSEETMERREALVGFGAIALAALGDRAAAEEHEHDHDHMHMHAANKFQALIDAAGDCVQKGQACVAHCNALLGEGDKDMSACQSTALQTLAICAALQELANLNSPHLAKAAAAASAICKACEEECRKHEKKHASCKACGEACVACAKQCDAIAA